MYPTRRIAAFALLVVLFAAGVAIVRELPPGVDSEQENPPAIRSKPTTRAVASPGDADRIPLPEAPQSASTGQPESAASLVKVSSAAAAPTASRTPALPAGAASQITSTRTPVPILDSKESPADWQITGSNSEGYTLLTDRSASLSGKACALLSSKEDTDSSRFGAIMQIASAQSFAGKRVEFSGYIATSEAPAGAALWLRADAADGATAGFENTMTRGVRGTEGWSYQYIVMDVPRDTALLAYGALLTGRGMLFIDDLQFRIVDEKTPVTAKPIERRNVGDRRYTYGVLQPRNLDFEETSR